MTLLLGLGAIVAIFVLLAIYKATQLDVRAASPIPECELPASATQNEPEVTLDILDPIEASEAVLPPEAFDGDSKYIAQIWELEAQVEELEMQLLSCQEDNDRLRAVRAEDDFYRGGPR